ncbi:hypothetical protein D8O27_12835 [Burkholderia mallei]|uniref:Uncharacterized protein n=2 Tax=Burkholderia mallei TaxID=13373 RepID=A0AAX1XF52_BURML|nr:hypothetical protein BMAA0807 [Burkholderia mallei ATCC 23344]KGS91942.1 hypothetical protein X963_5590 [Burkholderia pseudomallei MSHR7498]QCU48512.1 hypothetical protein FFM54_00665 [Burkholderia pseudomallei]RKN92714.1 hypothetical protein D8O31_27000 [Burkholderia mallei]RKN93619.1 hypothetical protein D8O03_26890 [Burkholderia mallei]
MRARRAHRTARAHALRRACRASGLLSGEGRRDASPPPRRIRDEAPPAVALLPQAPLLEHDVAALPRRRAIDVRVQPIRQVRRMREAAQHDVRPDPTRRASAPSGARSRRVRRRSAARWTAPDAGGAVVPRVVETAFVDPPPHVFGASQHRVGGWARLRVSERGRGRQCAGRRASSDECVQVASRPKRGDALRRGPTHRYSAAIASV